MNQCFGLLNFSVANHFCDQQLVRTKKLECALVVMVAMGSLIAIGIALASACGLQQGWVGVSGALTDKTIVLIVGGSTPVILLAFLIMRRAFAANPASQQVSQDVPSHSKDALKDPNPTQKEQVPSNNIDAVPVEHLVTTYEEASSTKSLSSQGLQQDLPLVYKDPNDIQVFGKQALLAKNIDIQEQEPPLPQIDTKNWPGFNANFFAWVWVPSTVRANNLIPSVLPSWTKTTISCFCNKLHKDDKELVMRMGDQSEELDCTLASGWRLMSRDIVNLRSHKNPYKECDVCLNLPRICRKQQRNFSVCIDEQYSPLAQHIQEELRVVPRRPYIREVLIGRLFGVIEPTETYYTCCAERYKDWNDYDEKYYCVIFHLGGKDRQDSKRKTDYLQLIDTRTDGHFDGHMGSLFVVDFSRVRPKQK